MTPRARRAATKPQQARAGEQTTKPQQTAVRRPLRRPASIVATVLLLACWWAYLLAVDVTLLAGVGGVGNWIALAGCTVAVVAVLRGLWHGGPLAWRVVRALAAPVALAVLAGIGGMLLYGPSPASLISAPVAPAGIAAVVGGLLAVLALLGGGLLVRTASARTWCGR
ncbi:hypothetical protein [Micromonospora sp. DT233]|uniref:hypothetical protein n=1 Tax=Micromonospora sp. DT233 TaxID=3393432 RepID=UPI003CE71687